MNKYYKKALSISKELVANRRTLHNYAETGFDLPRTTTFVMKKLNEYGLSPFPVGKSGICCILGNQGKTILLRADMDALPMKENTGLDFAATNGNCHSCGHDCHTAMLLGAAKLLKQNEDKLKGTVKFMFQPAEETIGGAEAMIAKGCMENPKVDYVFGLHMDPDIECGTIRSRVGALNANGDDIETYRALEKALKEGKTRAIGLSNFNIKQLDELMSNTEIVPAIDQIETHLYWQQQRMHPYLIEKGIVHESWAPLGENFGREMMNLPEITNLATKY